MKMVIKLDIFQIKDKCKNCKNPELWMDWYKSWKIVLMKCDDCQLNDYNEYYPNDNNKEVTNDSINFR